MPLRYNKVGNKYTDVKINIGLTDSDVELINEMVKNSLVYGDDLEICNAFINLSDYMKNVLITGVHYVGTNPQDLKKYGEHKNYIYYPKWKGWYPECSEISYILDPSSGKKIYKSGLSDNYYKLVPKFYLEKGDVIESTSGTKKPTLCNLPLYGLIIEIESDFENYSRMSQKEVRPLLDVKLIPELGEFFDEILIFKNSQFNKING